MVDGEKDPEYMYILFVNAATPVYPSCTTKEAFIIK